RFRWVKEKLCVHVGNHLAHDVFYAFAIAPPMAGIVVRIRDCDDADSDIMAKSFLEEEASATRMYVLGHNVDATHRHIVLTKPVPQRHRRTVSSVAVHDTRRNHLHEFVWKTGLC